MRYRTSALIIMLFLTIALGVLAWNQSEAVIDGTKYADGYANIVFGNITTADTLETVRVLGPYEVITYFINIVSRRHAGMATTDTVQVKLAASPQDSAYVNVSTTGATTTYTTSGLKTITFDYLSTHPYTRLEVPNLAAADSLTVQVKARVSTRRGR